MGTSNLKLTINNKPTSGASSDQIYVCIVGEQPNHPSKFGYLDCVSGQTVFADKDSWELNPETMVTKLEDITFPLDIPPMSSARIYFSIYENFSEFPESGPSASKENTVMFDKIEFENSDDNPNINLTSVDFYGISFTVSGTDSSGDARSYGYDKSRKEILHALAVWAPDPTSQRIGNNGIFDKCFLHNNDKEVLRVLAPKTMALTDWPAKSAHDCAWAERCSHFLDGYVKNHCFKGGRKFNFYSKNYPNDKTVYYGTTPKHGGCIYLWTDEACKQPYSDVPKLNLPCSPWGQPDFKSNPSLYHHVSGAQNEVDWGFLLLGNSVGQGAAAHWGSDPLCMAIMVSICRGVMHFDDGTTQWINSANYYQGDDTADQPVFLYAKALHANGKGGKAYVLSYDDVYGENPSLFFAGYPDVTIDLHGLDKVGPTRDEGNARL